MFDPHYFLKGAALGFSIAAPVGPIGILCIRRTLQFGRWSGLFSGLGATFADLLYGVIAAFGLTFISDFILAEKFWIRLLGGVFLLFLGMKTFFAKPIDLAHAKVNHKTLISDFFSTFLLTLSNPLTIFAFVAVFAALGLVHTSHKYTDALWLIFGIFVGSTVWWLLISEGITFFRKKLNRGIMPWINRFAGMLIIAFGLAVWLSILHT